MVGQNNRSSRETSKGSHKLHLLLYNYNTTLLYLGSFCHFDNDDIIRELMSTRPTSYLHQC